MKFSMLAIAATAMAASVSGFSPVTTAPKFGLMRQVSKGEETSTRDGRKTWPSQGRPQRGTQATKRNLIDYTEARRAVFALSCRALYCG